MGFFIGDGGFHRNKSHQKANKDYYLGLSLGLDKEEIFNKLIIPLKKSGYIKSHWWSNTRPGDIRFNGLKLIKIIAENCRNKDNKKIIPKWMFEEKEENISAFLRGLFSADGCGMIRNNAPIIKYTSINKDYIKEVRKLLYRTGISHSVFKENTMNKYRTKDKIYSSGSYSKNIIIKNKEDFVEKIGFLLERKNKRAKIKTNQQKKKLIKDFEFDLQQVKSIEKIKTPEYVYDIEVEDNHKFFANYVLAHNTDSIAFTSNKKSKIQIQKLLEDINKKLPGIMELDYEGSFKRGIWVTKRTGDFGAKKKYALIDKENKLKIRGFETVRRDWCDLARQTQNKILQLILQTGKSEKATEYLKKTVKELKQRKIPLKQLIIKTQLKKPIDEYKSINPHVTIAKRMKQKQMPVSIGTLIEYYIAEPETTKHKLVRERAKLPTEPGNYDISYYLKNQILPAVENILEVFDIDLEELLEGKKQMSLTDF
jgi:DNA polymerase I